MIFHRRNGREIAYREMRHGLVAGVAKIFGSDDLFVQRTGRDRVT